MERGREGQEDEGLLLNKLPLSKSLAFQDNLQPQGRRRSLVIVVDRYERGNILLRTFLLVSLADL